MTSAAWQAAQRATVLKGAERRSRMVGFIRAFQRDHGYSPTVREVGSAVGLHSTGAIMHHLAQLEAGGVITHEPSKSRTIRIVAGSGLAWNGDRAVMR